MTNTFLSTGNAIVTASLATWTAATVSEELRDFLTDHIINDSVIKIVCHDCQIACDRKNHDL
jgi:hypothetical protein